jgi:3-mercaptopyruvate sulfurtransferase SseA
VFDHDHLERYLADVMALAPGAMRMVVYCSGGDCEDSEFAAATLAGLLPDPSILRVYVGGLTEWEQHRMPIETGRSGSGEIRREVGGQTGGQAGSQAESQAGGDGR